MWRAFLLAVLAAGGASGENRIWIEDLDRSAMTCDYRQPLVGRSIEGGLLSIDGKTYAHGLGVHANSRLDVPLGGRALAFEAMVGIDDEKDGRSPASIEFKVWADGRLAATSGLLRRRRRSAHLHVNLEGVQVAVLEVTDGGDGNDSDHADWADAFFLFREGARPPRPSDLTPQLGTLTPPVPATPRVNGPDRFGVRVGHPILYRDRKSVV